ncbi:MAG: helix-turn-helix domain-containing protein [bacterium]
MSFKAMDAVFAKSQTKGPERAIMMVLAHHANESGFCWPSISRIAGYAGLHDRTVKKCLHRIAKSGEIAIEYRSAEVKTRGGRQTSNGYRIMLLGGGRGSLPLTPKVVADTPQGSDSSSPKVVADSPQGGGRRSPESLMNHNPESPMNHYTGGQRHEYRMPLLPSQERSSPSPESLEPY